MSSPSEYLFELLTEEIPAWMFESRLAILHSGLVEMFATSFGIPAGKDDIVVDATSRRIFFILHNFPGQLADREEEVKGPPVKAAYDASGQPTKALSGFLKKMGAAEADARREGDYVLLHRRVKGKSAGEILASEIPRIITSLRWPKMMKWGAGANAYIRPIHSVISLLDGSPLPVMLFDVTSGTTTKGHRTLSTDTITVANADDYVEKLRTSHVVARAEERVDSMRNQARKLAAAVGGVPAEDEGIWKQWRYLTESPLLVRAEFRPEFLELPDEILVTVMRVHQKQLPILVGKKISSSFLAVADQIGDPDGNIASGNSFVTNARFADARFFRETDRKRPLESRKNDLAHLQFHEKLGNYSEKTDRIVRLATEIAGKSGVDPGAPSEAARLAKCDLVTEMVKEFTELQGRIGGIYAREEEKPAEVWQAVYDHYSPGNTGDPLPRGVAGAVVSLADRIDTLAGFFLIGLKPTGSRDPFALRRAAQGLVQILLNEAGWTIDVGVDFLIDSAFAAYPGSDEDKNEPRKDLYDFISERVKTLLEDAPFSLAYDEVEAGMAAGWAASLPDLRRRIAAVRAVRDQPDFLSLLDSAKRIVNITAGQEAVEVNRALLGEPAEKRLNDLTDLVSDQIEELRKEGRYIEALDAFAAMAGELERFFVEVLVMVDDPAVKHNRIALLRRVGSLVHRIADVTMIVVDRKDYESRK